METIRNNENYNMEELFQEYDLSDEEFGAIVNFLYTENIPEVRVSIENNDFVVIDEENADISEIQYFIDMDIKGYILGVLWILLIGNKLDTKRNKNSFGNKFR